MIQFLLKLWPALIPFTLYFGWLSIARAQAKKKGLPITRFTDGPWVMTLIVSLLIGIGCFVFWGFSFEATSGDYHPPHLENGKVISGGVETQ